MRLRWGLSMLILIAAACGSEDASPSSTSADPATTSPSPTSTVTATTPTTIPLVPVDPEEAATRQQTPTTTAAPVDPTPPSTAPDPAIPASTLAPGDAPTVEILGQGRPLWFSVDGSTVMVASFDAAQPSPSCDGVTRPRLRRLVIDGSPPTVGILGENADVIGLLARSGTETAALLADCVGQITTMWVGREAPNGLLADVVAVPVSRPIAFVGSFTASADGSAFIGTTSGSESPDPSVVSIDTRTGSVTDLFPGQYVHITELADGTYIGLTWDDEVRVLAADGTLIDSVVGDAYGVSPDRRRVAIVTDEALVFGSADLASPTRVALPGAGSEALGVWKLAVLPQGVALGRLSGVDQPVWLATEDGHLVELLEPDQWGELVQRDDGAVLATSRPIVDPDQPFAEQTVIVTL